MKATKVFRQRYGKYLRKEIRQPLLLRQMLDDWFDTYKCSAGNPLRPARGQLDPLTGDTLFTSKTREAVLNCKDKAAYVQDPLPLDQMYRVIPPSPNLTHGLNEHLSRQGESSLESFHLTLAHFGNCSMRTSLADNLNLTGTARCNLSIRHKMRLTDENTAKRSKISAAFEGIVPFFNHTELGHINELALDAGASQDRVPFPMVKPLAADSGERFFSECLSWMRKTKPTYDENDQCACECCRKYRLNQIRKSKPATQTETTTMLTDAHIAGGTVDTTGHNNDTGTGGGNHAKLASAAPPTTEHRANQQLSQYQNVVRVHAVHQQQLTAPTPQAFWSTLTPPPQFAPAVPWMYPGFVPFATTVQTLPFCCGRYQQWHNSSGRRDRPPHDHHCQRSKIKCSEPVSK